jgi:hypothetical protein
MSSQNVPLDYDKTIFANYNINADVSEYSEQNKKVSSQHMTSQQLLMQNNTKNIYNPLYNPTDIIDNYVNHRQHIPDNQNNNLIQTTKNSKSTKSTKPTKIDPYFEYLQLNGLFDTSSELRYNVQYVHIDSAYRKKDPYNIIDKTFLLGHNPLSLNANLLTISINTIDPTIFYIGQKIILEGITSYVQTFRQNSSNLNIQFNTNSIFVNINQNPNLSYPLSIYANIDSTQMFVTISGILGNNLTSYIGNIPISYLNKTHQIYLINSNGNYNTNGFFIKLPFESDGTATTTDFNFTLEFTHYNGIPINQLNANYPINQNHSLGYQIIQNITQSGDESQIIVQIYPPLEQNYYYLYPNYNISNGVFGGTFIYIKTITSVVKGYPYPNSYNVSLNKTYSNIVQAKLISSQFPNSNKLFRQNINPNNRLYFQDIDTGDNIEYIEINEGTYTDDVFITLIENLFSKKIRPIDFANSGYAQNYYIKVTIDHTQNLIQFSNFRQQNIPNSIISITPPINQSDINIGVGQYTLTISHSNHNIKLVGTSIKFNNFIDHLGISANVLNQTHIISNIIDSNRYTIILSNINLSPTKTITNGGYAASVLVPTLFRLFFTEPDTMGTVIGFRNVPNKNSITPYAYVISNNVPYENELGVDSLDNPINYNNTPLIFGFPSYIFMSCAQLNPLYNIVEPFNLFGKINMLKTNITDYTNTDMLLNKLDSPPIFYYNPIAQIYELTFQFVDKFNKLYDFGLNDHSFIIELTMLDNIPENTGLNSTSSNNR